MRSRVELGIRVRCLFPEFVDYSATKQVRLLRKSSRERVMSKVNNNTNSTTSHNIACFSKSKQIDLISAAFYLFIYKP